MNFYVLGFVCTLATILVFEYAVTNRTVRRA
ncbi:protein of unknown function [Ruminococcaceae bacterium BL-4]|nr:protein of unknown function [Ruminococcaceae bacterium BL-4]